MTSNCIRHKLNCFKLFLTGLICLLVACKPSQQLADDLKTYQQRMASVLEQPDVGYNNVHLPAYPALSELRQDQPETTIKLAEFYQLQHCQLATIIAQRNTTLGKLQLPSTRFMYEKTVITSLVDCIAQTQDEKLKIKLQTWINFKSQSLIIAWADMLQTSTEVKQGLSSNIGFIIGDERDGLSETLLALTFLEQILHSPSIDSNELETHLHNIAKSSLLANLWRSQILLKENLENTTYWLQQQKLAEKCRTANTKTKQNLSYLLNVFQLYFIEKIQVVASQVNNYHYQISPKLESLLKHPELSPAFKHYIQQQHYQHFTDYQFAMKEHIDYWQNIFSQCQIKPGKR
jgi:hypothetical protein